MIVDPEDETTDEHEKRKRARTFRNRQIMALEIPTFCNMSKVMFYDVLMKLSHQTVKLYLEKDELKAMQRKLSTIKMMKNQGFINDTLEAMHQSIPGFLRSEKEFVELLEILKEKEPRADIVKEL